MVNPQTASGTLRQLAHLPAASLRRHGDGAEHRLDLASGDAGNRGVGIEQGGDARAKRGGGAEQLR
jgi:hypothetical protein